MVFIERRLRQSNSSVLQTQKEVTGVCDNVDQTRWLIKDQRLWRGAVGSVDVLTAGDYRIRGPREHRESSISRRTTRDQHPVVETRK